MPELPDVEYYKKVIERNGLRKKLRGLSCDDSVIYGRSSGTVRKHLKGNTFSHVERRGTYLMVHLAKGGYVLVVQFGATGSMEFCAKGECHSKKDDAPLRVLYKDGSELRYINKRGYGKIYFTQDIEEDIDGLSDLGPEPFDMTRRDFLFRVRKNTKMKAKAFLMNESLVAGIGNDYSNEVLFHAGVHPAREIGSLERLERMKLYNEMVKILKTAGNIHGPESVINRRWLLAHTKDKQCPKNPEHELVKKQVGGGRALFCPVHQALPEDDA